jgi:hypothetical protein
MTYDFAALQGPTVLQSLQSPHRDCIPTHQRWVGRANRSVLSFGCIPLW